MRTVRSAWKSRGTGGWLSANDVGQRYSAVTPWRTTGRRKVWGEFWPILAVAAARVSRCRWAYRWVLRSHRRLILVISPQCWHLVRSRAFSLAISS